MGKRKAKKADDDALEVYRISMVDGYSKAVRIIEDAIIWTAKYQTEKGTPSWVSDDLEELLEILEQIQS